MASSLLDSTARSSLSSICRSCRSARTSSQVRYFASSSVLKTRPESPDYIHVPRLLQPEQPFKKPVKGVLPVPREIFPRRRPDKPTAAYRDAATPLSQAPKLDPSHPKYEHLEWKRKMAAQRRENLQKGLIQLYERKQKINSAIAARGERLQNQRDTLLKQGPRMDERLTNQSIIKVMQYQPRHVLPDPDREERIARARANTEAHMAKKKEQRHDAIHTLYMNARNFIITEPQLQEEINRVFPDGENPAWTNDAEAGENIWNLGNPPTVESMVGRAKRSLAPWAVEQERIKKLAEELTGGTI